MNKPTIGIDIDGTLTEFFTFLPYLNKLLGKSVTAEQLVQYDLHEIFGMEYEAFSNLFDEHSIPMYRDALPRSCAQKELKWIDELYEVFYITARYQCFKELTKEWLIRQGFPDRTIICTGSHDKIEAIRGHGIQVMVEDRLENAQDIWNTLQIPVFLLDTPYNQANLPGGIIRVQNWHEIREKLPSLSPARHIPSIE